MPFPRVIACLCCCWALAGAAEGGNAQPAATEPAFQPFLLGWDAGEGGKVSLDPKTPSVFSGGVVVRYEKVIVACETMSFWLSTVKGEERLLERAELVPGPHARDPQHVLLDSSKSKLASVGFRGSFRPSRVTIERRREAVDQAAGGTTRYVVRLEDLDAFSGMVRLKDGWLPLVGWARSAEMVVVGDLKDGQFGNAKVGAIHLVGEPSTDPKLRKRAWLLELDRAKVSDPATVDPQPLIAQDADAKDRLWTCRQGSTELSLLFDSDGAFVGAQGGADWTMDGIPHAPTKKNSRARLEDP